MNQNVSLRDAVSALREVSGESHDADATSRRVLGTVRHRKRIRRQALAVAAVVLLGFPFGTTAYAAFFGTPAFVQAWLDQLAPRVVADRPVAQAVAASRSAHPERVIASPGVAPPVEEVTSAEPAPLPAPAVTPVRTSGSDPTLSQRPTPSLSTSSGTHRRRAATAPPSPTATASSTEAAHVSQADALYARAHQLHFVTRDPEAALAAWDTYLEHVRDLSSATLRPEAQYNRALCLVRLHRTDEALDALAPFADGTHGSYRRREATALINALTPGAQK